ncbi:MAG: hypothetical protein HY706_07950 [Candidatus Hydrogenedentes bacterium]|nr:hypothetical protein [Candidatus Hydrogenedentota bacterium]
MRPILCFLAVVVLAPAAYAEPSVNGGFHIVLWLIVFAGAAVSAAVPVLIKKCFKPVMPAWLFWIAVIGLPVLFILFAAPIIVGIGSILITGRTM